MSWVFSPTSAEDFLTFSSVDSELSISPSAAVVAQTYSVTLTATPSNKVSSCSTTLSIVVVPKNTCPTLLHFGSFGNAVRQINLGDSIITDLSTNDVDAGQTVSRLSTKVGEEFVHSLAWASFASDQLSLTPPAAGEHTVTVVLKDTAPFPCEISYTF